MGDIERNEPASCQGRAFGQSCQAAPPFGCDRRFPFNVGPRNNRYEGLAATLCESCIAIFLFA
jgi:hypothetical protein